MHTGPAVARKSAQVEANARRRTRRLSMKTDIELDARGLNCPLPILRAKKALNDMRSGQTLKIMATDPGSAQDFRVFAERTGHALLELQETGGEYTIILKKA